MSILYLAFAYLRFHWIRSLVLVLVAALILAVPMVSHTLLRGSQEALTNRAEATPLLLGRRGSQIDMVMNALYFADERATPITMAATEEIWDSGLAIPVPLHTAFETNGARIVGTTLDYFDYRALEVADGRQIAVLGEAVLGAAVAQRLGLGPGDTVVSAPQNLFDLDGVYPLELKITGVLAPTGTPDDDAVFADIKTAWVIAGIGHGHDDVVSVDASDENVAAAASLLQFNRITPENIDSFHFHGDPDDYPVSSIVVSPYDDRSATILRGRYLDPENPLQMVVPSEVIGDLVARIFRIKTLLDAVTVIVSAAALAAVALAVFLSYRLRAPEMRTAFKIGAGRGTILRLLGAETALILSASAVLAALCVILVQSRGDRLVAYLLSL